jgi:hypothetical protein
LLGEPDSCFLLLDPRPCSYRGEDVVHDGAAHAREHDDPVENEEDVVPTKSEFARGLIVVGNAKKLLGMMAGARKGHMREEEDREEMDRYAYKSISTRWEGVAMLLMTELIWWSTAHVQAWAIVLFSFPFPRQRGIAVFCDGEALCGRCSTAIPPLMLNFS